MSRGGWSLPCAVALFAALVVAACGSETAGDGEPTVSLHITRDFGTELVARHDAVPLEEARTVLELLEGHHEVEPHPTFESLSVHSIDGLTQQVGPVGVPRREWRRQQAGLRAEGRDPSKAIWVIVVNGITADPQPEDFELHPGDVVQADLRDWEAHTSIRATVGAFPQPFTGGMYGHRFPTTVHCAQPRSQACIAVEDQLRAEGVDPDGPRPARSQTGVGPRVRHVDVVVGAWREIRRLPLVSELPEGLAYARVHPVFTASGDGLTLRDWDTRPVRTEGPGTGFVGAMKASETNVVWLVTGVDEEGVARAARALHSRGLRDAYAAAVTEDGVVKLALEPPRFARP